MDAVSPVVSKSTFDGGVMEYLGIAILGGLAASFTFGLLAPWAACKYFDWQISHTVIDGKRLKFSGKAMSLFPLVVKWVVLSIVTLGIYGLWVTIELEKWKAENTSFV